MSLTLSFLTLDVFTTERFEGNPLGLVLLSPQEAAALTQESKQRIAKEFNLSETLFLHTTPIADQDGTTLAVDIFTTQAELPFAGHPTIGAAVFAATSLTKATAGGPFTLLTKAGPIPITVSVRGGDIYASARIPHNINLHAGTVSASQLIESLPSLAGVPGFTGTFPVLSVVKGMTFIYVELPNLEALALATTGGKVPDVKLDDGWALSKDKSFVGAYFYTKVGTSPDGAVQVRTRMIEGSLEDPATGSAASGLSALLTIKEGKTEASYEITQGVEMGRKSLIAIDVKMKGPKEVDSIVDSITLSGSAVQVMKGQIDV